MSQTIPASDAAKTDALIKLILPQLDRPPSRVLVVGCGSGYEAGILARALGADTFGIDIGAEFASDYESAKPATLRLMDAQALSFEDERSISSILFTPWSTSPTSAKPFGR